ncbi:MAG: DinB family protein [Cytophagaceae bacterium]|nr:DinB family protein [Cytophagaceae bacterium]MDW8455909.1 DinB family protein [Cytophagaceae bacterium]
MKFIFDALIQIRTNCWRAIEHLSIEQLHKIPQGCNNNIAWNLGHMVTSQQLLTYAKCNLPLLIPDEYLPLFRKDTSPKDWAKPADIEEMRRIFAHSNDMFYRDYVSNKFQNYQAYTTSSGLTLKHIDDALIYNYGHETLHYGVILMLRKLV